MSRESLNSVHRVAFQPQTTAATPTGAKQLTLTTAFKLNCRVVSEGSVEWMVGQQREWKITYSVFTSTESPWHNHDQIAVLSGPYKGKTMRCEGNPVGSSMGRLWKSTFTALEYRQPANQVNNVQLPST